MPPKKLSDNELLPGSHSERKASNMKVELKLSGEAVALQELWDKAIAPAVPAVTKHLRRTYYDTSDFRLHKRGFSLHVCQEAGSFLQVLKLEGPEQEGQLQHGTWTAELPDARPNLVKVDAPDILERIGLVIPGELQPIFTTEVERLVKRYRVKGSSRDKAYIAASLDHGTISCGERRQAINELELELLEGAPVALHKEAARLHSQCPLQFLSRSKASRGFALALDEKPRGWRSAPERFSIYASVDEGLSKVFANCFKHWLANHAAVLDGSDTEGVHQMRVALRRLRSALGLFREVFPPEDYAWLQRESKALISALGSARDWDVFVDELLDPLLKARKDDPNLRTLAEAVAEQRRLAQDRAQNALAAPAYLAFVLRFGIWQEERGWRSQDKEYHLQGRLIYFADEILAQRHKKALKKGKHFDRLSDEGLHDLRITLKKLRYATEFFASLYDTDGIRPYLKSLRQLQDDLGHLNDVAVAEARLNTLCSNSANDNVGALQIAAGTVIGWYCHAFEQLRPRIKKDWVSFRETTPFWELENSGRLK